MAFERGYALLVGVGSYRFMPKSNIPVSVRDAQQVHDVLRNERFCGYLPQKVTLLHDELASREGILAALRNIAQRTTEADTVFLYYSGHGEFGSDGLFYMTCHDTRAEGRKIVPETGISEIDLLDALRAIPANRLIFFFNACHSGQVSPHLGLEDEGNDFDAAFGTTTMPNATADAILASGSGRVIVSACRENQFSWIGRGETSIFAKALVEGLKGRARNNTGYIGAFGLYEYLFETVKEAAKDLGAEQEPELTVLKGVGPFPVALYRGSSEPQVFEIQEDLPEDYPVRIISERASQREFQRISNTVIQTGGGAVFTGNIQSGSGDVVGRDQSKVTVQGDIQGSVVVGRSNISTGQRAIGINGDVSETILSTGTLNLFFTNYQTPSGRPRLGKEDFERILQEYLRWVIRAYGKARLYGLESMRVTRERPNRPLADVFVPLTLHRYSPPTRKEIEEIAQEMKGDSKAYQRAYLRALENRRKQGVAVNLQNLMTISNRLAIIGGAGSGKSTLAAYLAASLAIAALKGEKPPFPLPYGRTQLLPIVVPLRYYREYLRLCTDAPHERLHNARAGWLAGLIPWYLHRRNPALELSEDFIDRLLLGGGCLLILDGLDEVANRNERGRVRAQVETLANDIYPGNLVLVTARDSGYREDAVFGDDFTRLDVQPLDEYQTSILVGNWCRLLYPESIEAKTKDILKAISEINQRYIQQNLPPLVSTPLMTTMVVSVRWGENELPRERARLYEAAVKVILQAQYLEEDETRQELVNWGGPWDEQREWLAHLALDMQRGGRDGAAIPEERVREILSNVPGMSREKLDIFIQAVRLRGGLFEERAELFQFAHLTFQEFLAARLLVKMRQEGLASLSRLATEAWWREVCLLMYGIARDDYSPFAAQYLEWLGQLTPDDHRLAGLELAAAAILEIERPDPVLRQSQAARLLDAILDTHRETRPSTRAQAGNRLAALGDPRFNAEVWYLPSDPLLGFVEIPAGPFLMGSDPGKDKKAKDNERPQHLVNLPTFYVARLPVTVAQFRAFAKQAKYKPSNDVSLRGNANHPVTYVTWHDARAYCDWLDKTMRQSSNTPSTLTALLAEGYHLCLPSEAEWEKAARGADGRIYPWGNDFDKNKANTFETQLGTTSPVGCFVGGVSPYGCMDMSGNVFEWCTDWYEENYCYVPSKQKPLKSEQGSNRVLRGGSWNVNRYSARCASRSLDHPDTNYNYIGFRCVLSR